MCQFLSLDSIPARYFVESYAIRQVTWRKRQLRRFPRLLQRKGVEAAEKDKEGRQTNAVGDRVPLSTAHAEKKTMTMHL